MRRKTSLRRARRPAAILAVVMAGVSLAGCIGALDAEEFEAELQSRRIDLDADAGTQGLAALEAELATDEIRLVRLTVDPPEVIYWVADADDPEQADAWRWDGIELSGPSPVPAVEVERFGGRTFTGGDVPALDRIDELGRAAPRAVDLEGASLSGILVADEGAGVGIVVAVRAEGERRHVVFSADGDLEEVRDP